MWLIFLISYHASITSTPNSWLDGRERRWLDKLWYWKIFSKVWEFKKWNLFSVTYTFIFWANITSWLRDTNEVNDGNAILRLAISFNKHALPRIYKDTRNLLQWEKKRWTLNSFRSSLLSPHMALLCDGNMCS